MKDWFQNVAMGQRFADVMANHKDTPITKKVMKVAIKEMLDAAENQKYLREALKFIEGRAISDLLTDKSKGGQKLAAVAVRLMSTHVHGLTHDVLSPEGESLGIRKNLDGSSKKMVWQSYPFIEKALSIYEDGSLENISKNLGTEHKIRNFYNNIIAPTSPRGDATVDTHAVNAAVLFPMGGSAYLPTLNFGAAGVAGGGNSGIYWLFHEALREAAAERDVMPRQMQSITWEAIRGLFTDTLKRDKKFIDKIIQIWESSPDAETARTRILELGINPPEWARVGAGSLGGEAGMAGDSGQGTDSEGSVRSGVRQGRTSGTSSSIVGPSYSLAPLASFTTKAEREYAFGDGRYTHPVTLANGSRLSGETFDYKWGSKIEVGKTGGIPTFFGYTKNGDEITIDARSVRPEMLVSSRDGNRTANDLRDRLAMWHEKAREQGFDFLSAENSYSLAPRTQQDSEYLAAVKAGDMEKAQRMVDEAAIYDNTPRKDIDRGIPKGIIEPEIRSDFAAYIKASRKIAYQYKQGGKSERVSSPQQTGAERRAYKQLTAKYSELHPEDFLREGLANQERAFRSLTDPVTYDSDGNVIPLSQRFNPESPSISYSLAPRTQQDSEYLAAVKAGDMVKNMPGI